MLKFHIWNFVVKTNDSGSPQLKMCMILIFDSGISNFYEEGTMPTFLSYIELFSIPTSLKPSFSYSWMSQPPGGKTNLLREREEIFFPERPPKMMVRRIF